MAEQTYVSTAAWLRPAGRPDHVDEIADQFERPAAHGAESSAAPSTRWPRTSLGWRKVPRVRPRVAVRRAG